MCDSSQIVKSKCDSHSSQLISLIHEAQGNVGKIYPWLVRWERRRMDNGNSICFKCTTLILAVSVDIILNMINLEELGGNV